MLYNLVLRTLQHKVQFNTEHTNTQVLIYKKNLSCTCILLCDVCQMGM